jgi:hypothetical protein
MSGSLRYDLGYQPFLFRVAEAVRLHTREGAGISQDPAAASELGSYSLDTPIGEDSGGIETLDHAVLLAAIFHRSRRRLIFLVGAAHDDLERVVGQWPLQRLRLVPRRARVRSHFNTWASIGPPMLKRPPGLRKEPTQVWRSGGALLRVAALKPLCKSCRPDRA